MPQKLTETATLQCDKGAAPSQLKVSSQNFCKADNKLVATEQDKQAEANIPNFGVCAITKSKCAPAVVQWQKTTDKDTVNNYKILLETSFCMCSIGGKIKPQNTGHSEAHGAD